MPLTARRTSKGHDRHNEQHETRGLVAPVVNRSGVAPDGFIQQWGLGSSLPVGGSLRDARLPANAIDEPFGRLSDHALEVPGEVRLIRVV